MTEGGNIERDDLGRDGLYQEAGVVPEHAQELEAHTVKNVMIAVAENGYTLVASDQYGDQNNYVAFTFSDLVERLRNLLQPTD